MIKLSNRGFSHLLVPVLVFLMVAGLGGAYFLATSHAAPLTTSNSSTASTTSSSGSGETTAGDSFDPATDADNANKFVAAAASTADTSGTNKICLNADRNKCLVVHGINNQLTIQGTGTTPSRWVIRVTSNGYAMFQDGQGNCMRANSNNRVTIESGNCSSGEDGEKWIVVNSAPFRFVSYKFRTPPNIQYLATYDHNAGDKVWGLNPEAGGLYVSWLPL